MHAVFGAVSGLIGIAFTTVLLANGAFEPVAPSGSFDSGAETLALRTFGLMLGLLGAAAVAGGMRAWHEEQRGAGVAVATGAATFVLLLYAFGTA